MAIKDGKIDGDNISFSVSIDMGGQDGHFAKQNFYAKRKEARIKTLSINHCFAHSGFLNEDGWCCDQMADGPNGTSYRALRKNVFCAVEGSWDGGDDSDPTYVPSPHYEVIVKCANR